MRTLIWLIGITPIVFTSCTKYQYATIDSNLTKNDTSEFVHENDTFKIKYWFSGRNCPIHIEVFNKSSKPLYVDWKKSALIINEKRYAYWTDESTIDVHSLEGEISTVSRGTAFRDEQISFLPPQSYVTVSRLTVKNEFFDLSNPTESQKVLLGLNNGYAKGTRFRYLSEEKPLRFRSYLTLSTTENFADPITYDDQFWVSDIIATTASPESRYYKPANQFFVYKTTTFAKTAIVVGLIGFIATPFLMFSGAIHSMPPY